MPTNNGIPQRGFVAGKNVSAGTLEAMRKALFGARGTNGIYVRFENGVMVVEGSNFAKPFTISDVSNPTDGWQILVAPGYILTANDINHTPTNVQYSGTDLLSAGPIPVADSVSYVAVKVTCDTDEELDGIPEIVLIDTGDWYPVDDPFLYGFYAVAKITKAGDVLLPSITVNAQYIDHHLAHRKANTTHIWGAM